MGEISKWDEREKGVRGAGSCDAAAVRSGSAGPPSGRGVSSTLNCFLTISACFSNRPPQRRTFQVGSSMIVLPMPWSLMYLLVP